MLYYVALFVKYLINPWWFHRTLSAFSLVLFSVKVRVRILYSQDHRLHRCVVERFITFLKEVCDCDVETEDDRPPNQTLDTWLCESVIEKDLKIIIVGSKGTLQKAQSVFHGDQDKYKGDSFTKACKILKHAKIENPDQYEEVRGRISVVCFPYSPSMASFPFEGRTKKSYTLMSDIRDFVQLEIQSRSLVDIMQRRNSDVCVALQKAIEDMEDFEKGNHDVVLTPYDNNSTPHVSESDSEGFNEPNNSSLQRLLDNSSTSQPSFKDRQNPTTGRPTPDMGSASTFYTISEKNLDIIAPIGYSSPSIDTAMLSGPACRREPGHQPLEDKTDFGDPVESETVDTTILSIAL